MKGATGAALSGAICGAVPEDTGDAVAGAGGCLSLTLGDGGIDADGM